MPDFPTTGPAAGWYTDPADSRMERWWSGADWTHDVRPQAAPAPAYTASVPAYTAPAAPVAAPTTAGYSAVPGGGVNPFAAVDAAAQSTYDPSVDSFGLGGGQSPFSGAQSFGSSSGFGSSYDPGQPAATTPSNPFASSEAWFESSRRAPVGPPPTNGVATAALVLGILGWNIVAIILGAIGLRKAREFQQIGELPVGRKRAGWGLGLGIVSLIVNAALIVFYILVLQYVYGPLFGIAAFADQNSDEPAAIVTEFEPIASGASSSGGDFADGTYDRAAYEQSIYTEYAEDGLATPDSVECPDQGSLAEGAIITCVIVTGEVTEIRTAEYFADGGYSIFTVPM